VCGILAIATAGASHVRLDDGVVARMRDRMRHRGPDGEGLWREGNVVLAHRRLAVIDPSPAGAQPMVSACGRYVLSYNGELYNDLDLREVLRARGVVFRTGCDTETVLAALAAWGSAGLGRLRGMYALALHDRVEKKLLLARDPLGVKPLWWWRGRARDEDAESIVAASEIPAILEHPGIDAAPDMAGVSAYLTTIRTSVGDRSMFSGVRTLRPGEAMEVSLGGPTMAVRRWRHWVTGARVEDEAGAGRVRAVVVDSVKRHLRADVPTCALLSGGLDSSIITRIAVECVTSLRTYCSGAREQEGGGDFEHARLLAAHLGLMHTEAPIGRELFHERWAAMVEALGIPLGTPNEVAINEVARVLRSQGNVVAMSGEGADELFGGYGPVMEAAAASVAAKDDDPAMVQLALASWIPIEAKEMVLKPDVWRSVERDEVLVEAWRDEFAGAVADGPPGDALQAHLRFQRRVNLAGLLSRLDTATMLESVEGRTPLADVVVADLAERLPMREKFVPGEAGATKVALRAAFGDVLARSVVRRAKASFPLPFQGWVGDCVDELRERSFARDLFSDGVIEGVTGSPETLWNLAWPMLNAARWGDRWFS
jgi:asparagine synthase (glutamine-hydrolysing)